MLYNLIKVVRLLCLFGQALAVECVVLVSGMDSSSIMGDAPGVRENVALIELQKAVKLDYPVNHAHGNAPHGLAFSKNKILLDQVVQHGQLLFVQVVFGNGDIFFTRLCASPVGQPNVGLVAVGSGMDDFSSGLAGDGPVHLVLHGLEKDKAGFSCRIVVNTGGVEPGTYLLHHVFYLGYGRYLSPYYSIALFVSKPINTGLHLLLLPLLYQ